MIGSSVTAIGSTSTTKSGMGILYYISRSRNNGTVVLLHSINNRVGATNIDFLTVDINKCIDIVLFGSKG